MPIFGAAAVRRSTSIPNGEAPESAPLILVVDDFDDTRELYVSCLRESGYRVEEASDGREALDKIRLVDPDLVIMDLSMPVLDGWEATRRIKARVETAHIPVIAITSHGTEERLRDATAAGADAVVTRPCLPADLMIRVGALLGPRYAGTARRHVVLLVDADDDSRQLFTFVLVRFGFEVVAATSADQARVAHGLQRADVLIVNETRSEGAGALVLERLGKEARPGLRIVVGGFESPIALRRNREAGFHVHAPIPCTPFDLEPLLRDRLLLADAGSADDEGFSVLRGGLVEPRG
jgi:two-component system cell cycle response regulator DivK